MRIEVHNKCSDFDSYRAARVKSLFNVESGCDFDLVADLPVDGNNWKVGLIVGPSGSGKTSIGRKFFGENKIYEPSDWPSDKPIIDAISPGGDFDEITASLSAVGLGTVPSWLRPYPVLSNGEQFRADLARVISESPKEVVIDEFTSVVDRQIAKVGALAFSKAWKRTGGQCVLLSCHYDIIDWVEPCWVFDTATGKYSGRCLWRRPPLTLKIWQTDWRYWPAFERHHYLKLPNMIAAYCYVATINGERVAHVAVTTTPGLREARPARLVVMPEWQGVGVGKRFLNTIAQMWLEGKNPYNKPMTTKFNTSHPGLAASLRRDKKWVQTSAKLHGNKKAHLSFVGGKHGGRTKKEASLRSGYGGHFRAIQGFRYIGAQDT